MKNGIEKVQSCLCYIYNFITHLYVTAKKHINLFSMYADSLGIMMSHVVMIEQRCCFLLQFIFDREGIRNHFSCLKSSDAAGFQSLFGIT